MQKRVLLLPIIWGGYGLSEVYASTYILGPILNDLPYAASDKPIGGSYLPLLGYNVGSLLLMIGLSLWALGIWKIDFSNGKTRRDITALSVSIGSLFAVFYAPVFLFSAVVSLIYLMATNLD